MPTYSLSILNILVLFGAFQGLVLAFILISTKRLRKKSNTYLALVLISISLLSVMLTMEDLETWTQDIYMNCFPVVWMNLIPAATYFFIIFLIDPTRKFRKFEVLFFLPFAIEFFFHFQRFVKYASGGTYTENQLSQYFFMSNVFESFAVLATIAVNIYGIIQLKQYEQKLYENYSEVEEKSLAWLRYTFIVGLVLSSLWAVLAISDFSVNTIDSYLSDLVVVGLCFLIYWIGYSMIIRQGLLSTPIFAISNQSGGSKSVVELSERTDEHYQKILQLLEEEKLYRDPNLNMSMLSKRTGLSNGYLSQIINHKRRQNFFNLINSYRVQDVKRKMADPTMEHYSLLGLAYEAGFKSKSTFNAVFKKITGMTPSEYKNSLS